MKLNRKTHKKIALALSVCLIVIWATLGTGASLAWFADTSPEIKNIFHIAEFDLDVSYRLEDGEYEEINAQTKVFDDETLYEPGYVQVVYLKVENKGTVPFDFKTAVNVTDYTLATNMFGHTFNLQEYLKFGIVSADTEKAIEEKIVDREIAKKFAVSKLNNYSTDISEVAAKDTVYMALIVYMPEEVDNVANYRGKIVPKVELGVIFSASQKSD